MNITTELKPLHRKSFYGKCHVNQYENDNELILDLVSYDTRVASYNYSTKELSIYGWFSATTARHINAFIIQFGFEPMTKKQMENF